MGDEKVTEGKWVMMTGALRAGRKGRKLVVIDLVILSFASHT